ncbi:MAG: hypothetical protein MI747_25715 [Desulfobacterales bacterium]|nr:hypothetical protein [Desulfobacterales bacterium]
MGGSYSQRLILVSIVLLAAAGAGLLVKMLLTPSSFGIYGPYRADAIIESASVPIRHGTTASCAQCHAWEADAHYMGLHKSISCEFCHGTLGDHVADGKKIAVLPVKTGEEITTLCLRCHNTEIKARDEAVIKTVALPQHLTDQKVKPTHTCNQCHYVHAPMKFIERARKVTGEEEEIL